MSRRGHTVGHRLAGTLALYLLLRPLLRLLLGLPLRLLFGGRRRLLTAAALVAAPWLSPLLPALSPGLLPPGLLPPGLLPPGLLSLVPAHAQEAQPGADAPPPAEARRDGGGSPGLGDFGRVLGDVLGGVRTISDTTSGISDATRSVAEYVARLGTINWQELVWRMFLLIAVRLLQSSVQLLHLVVSRLLDSSFNFITQTPAAVSYQSETVYDMWHKVRLLANAGAALIALGGGLNVILQRRLGTPYHGAAEFLPRLAVGLALANTSFVWTGLAIQLNNALSAAVGESSLPGWDRATPAAFTDVENQGLEAIAYLCLANLYLVFALLLLVQMLLRLALVDLLIVVAPLATVLLILPQTTGWWQRWSTSFSSVVFAQFVQVVALKLGGNLMFDFAAGAPDALLIGRVLGVAMLALTFKIPGLLHAHVGDGISATRQLAVRAAERVLLRQGR